MSRYIGPKCKLCRREGEKLFLKGERCSTPKCAMVKKAYPPGMHGSKGGRLSEYGSQLRAKQKIKKIYGILESQFKNYYLKSSRKRGVTGDLLLRFLESRLDNTVFRLGFAKSRIQARQLVDHGAISVNGKKVTIPSYQISSGDEIAIREAKGNKKYFKLLLKTISNKNIPGWLSLDVKNLKGKVIALPSREDIDMSVDTRLVVELYSR
ncbi:MAG: hypothetical protein ACD_63C00106G0007 [uncultured bacterium]|nr:MAG: hypothetical protein ACD_63C00106G0007 [uncultured bacterium]